MDLACFNAKPFHDEKALEDRILLTSSPQGLDKDIVWCAKWPGGRSLLWQSCPVYSARIQFHCMVTYYRSARHLFDVNVSLVVVVFFSFCCYCLALSSHAATTKSVANLYPSFLNSMFNQADIHLQALDDNRLSLPNYCMSLSTNPPILPTNPPTNPPTHQPFDLGNPTPGRWSEAC